MSARVRRNALQARGTRRENPCAYGRVASESLIYDNQDRIVGYGSNIEYEFTDNGELLTRTDTATNDVTEHAYDAVGNLRAVTLPNGDEIEYLVDGQGRRVGKTVNGVFERGWLWRGQLQPVAEVDSSGNVAKRFVYAGGVNSPALMITSTATYRVVKDHLGSVRFVIDVATGGVVQELAYDAWGRVVLDTNPGFQPFGFAGGLYEAETRLVRFGARDYDAEIGRWTAKDPIGFEGGINLYEYARGTPTTQTDPRGLCAICIPIGQAIVQGGGTAAAASGAGGIAALAGPAIFVVAVNVAIPSSIGDYDCDDGSCAPANDNTSDNSCPDFFPPLMPPSPDSGDDCEDRVFACDACCVTSFEGAEQDGCVSECSEAYELCKVAGPSAALTGFVCWK